VVAVRVLGPVALVTADGTPVELPSATQRRLLALLAVHAGRPVRAELLSDELDLGAGALRKVVSRLRSVVGDALRTSATGYQLDLDVDGVRFAEVVLEREPSPGRAERLAEALAWWHGDALDEFAAETWAMADAARFETLRAAAIEELAEHLIATRSAAEAIVLLEPHAARHPLAEPAHALLVRALAGAGRHTDALRTAHRYRTDLREVAGLDPSSDFASIEQRLTDGWDGRRTDGPDHRGATPSVPATPMVPRPATSRVGPAAPLDAVVADLAVHRVVTLTGPGGVGKTRTSLEAAAHVAATFLDGVVVVDLAPLTSDASVPDAVAAALGAATRSGLTVTASIVERLSGSRLLLVLDNCEHVVDGAAALVRAVVAGCTAVTVLTTSREALGVRGERVVSVHPLAIDDAVELFAERAAVLGHEIADGDERAAVEAVCRRLDGLPLAVELAAARVRSIAPADLLARLGRRFEVLGTARDGQYHQRTLWATIDWSYQLLDDDERELFEQLSVFHGSFDLDAVEQVCVVAQVDPSSVGALLAGLVEQSMVVAERARGGMRYRLLETLRQFAETRLAERGGTDAAAQRHLGHYVAAAEMAGRRWFSREQVAADSWFADEWPNLRAAHTWALATGELALGERLLLATIAHSQSRMLGEHGSWCMAAIASAERHADGPSAALLGWGAWWAMIGGDQPRAIEWSRRGRSFPADLADPGAAICRSVLVFALWSTGNKADATELVGELESTLPLLPPWEAYTGHRALFAYSPPDAFRERASRIAEITEAIGSPSLVASARFYQGTAELSSGDRADRATVFHREGIVLARSTGAELAECQNLQGLLDAEVMLDAPTARSVCVEALGRLYELRYWLYLWRVLDGAACLVARAGRMHEAGLLLGHLDRVALPWRTRPRSITRALVTEAGVPDEVLERGAALDRDAAVELALTALR
jgi:predicted ATPase/DNA-binding SARP family transcriptional activator